MKDYAGGCAQQMQPSRCAARSFDFSGSGLSDGEFVSLGWWEREDLAAVIEYLRTQPEARAALGSGSECLDRTTHAAPQF